MAPSCSNYMAKTFAHVAGLVGITALGTQINMPPPPKSLQGTVGKIVSLAIIVGAFFGFMMMPPGPFKYIAAVAVALFFGAIMHDLVEKLIEKDELTKVLVYLTGISVAMIGLALMDKSGQFLKLFPVLLTGLLVVTIISLYYFFKEEKRPKWLSAAVGALFAIFLAFDTQVLREKAAFCRPGKADYINESLDLYLDLLNLFQALGSD